MGAESNIGEILVRSVRRRPVLSEFKRFFFMLLVSSTFQRRMSDYIEAEFQMGKSWLGGVPYRRSPVWEES